jgi:hypothetical protein
MNYFRFYMNRLSSASKTSALSPKAKVNDAKCV